MKFKPKSEDEVRRIFEKGDYYFEVSDAEEREDKNGNQMLHVKINIHHNEITGKTNLVDVYFTSNPNFEFLLRHFMHSINMGDVYDCGEVTPSQIKGKKGGKVRIGIKVDKDGVYADKNQALDFLSFEKESKNNTKNYAPNDDIPF